MKRFEEGLKTHLPNNSVHAKHTLLHQLLQVWHTFDPNGPQRVFWVPGRIEVLGKHTDYCGGRSLLATASRGFLFGVTPRKDQIIRVRDAISGEHFQCELQRDIHPKQGHWSNYPETVFRRIAHNFPGSLVGADIAFASDLPPAAGMSSSSALMVGFFLVMDAVNQLTHRQEYRDNVKTAEDLAGYLGTLENGQTFKGLVGDKGVGTFGGSEDHTAIMNCLKGKVSQYSYCPVTFERTIDVPQTHTFAIGVSGVVAEKTGDAMAKYNRASGMAFTVLDVWNLATQRQDPNLAAVLKHAGADEVRQILIKSQSMEFGPEELVRRFDHFVLENEELLPKAGDALSAGDVEGFADWAYQSQIHGAKLLQNQIPETEALASLAVQLGAKGASAFGAGFGGSVWALVARNDMEDFLQAWNNAYLAQFQNHASSSQFFSTDPSVGAFEVLG